VTAHAEVLVIGDYFLDVVIAGLPGWPEPDSEVFGDLLTTVPGGAYTHTLALHRLGVKVHWLAEFGNDLQSTQVRAAARAEGLDPAQWVYHDGPVRNLTLAISHGGNRGFVSYREPRPLLPAAAAIQASRPRVVLLPQLVWGEPAADVLDAADQVGAEVLMDCQHTTATLATPGVVATLRRVHVFAPNAAEARRLTGMRELAKATRALGQIVPTVVIKDGPRGARAIHKGTVVQAPTLPVATVDTTGAGDCFVAGLLFGRLNGYPLTDCLRLANACGALSTTGYGSTATPTLAQLAAATSTLLDGSS